MKSISHRTITFFKKILYHFFEENNFTIAQQQLLRAKKEYSVALLVIRIDKRFQEDTATPKYLSA
jgi:hypothetical protein